MARTCEITGKTSRVGGGYSNRVRATKFNPTGKRRRQVNLQKKTLFIPELNKKVTINVSAKGAAVSGAGCPYLLLHPREKTPYVGFTKPKNSSDEEFFDPWCPAFKTSE